MKSEFRSQKLYLFDFDGTLLKKDSMILFLKALYKGSIVLFYVINIFSIPLFLLYILRIINKSQFKECFLKINLYPFQQAYIRAISNNFSNSIKKYFFEDALNYLETIKNERIVFVTASLDIWMNDIANELGVELICTRSKWENTKFKGIIGENCNGEEKVRRLTKIIDLSRYPQIYAFGNSLGDIPLLKISNHKHYRFFKK